MATGDLRIETRQGVLYVLIDRAEKRNALSRSVLDQLGAAFSAAADDDGLSAAVLRGAGDKSFAAGGDLRDLASVRTLAEAEEMSLQAKAALEAIRRFPVPVIAALNGDALGGGAELAAACDFRVFAPHARIGFIQGRLNITSAWGGGIDLMRLVGPARALRMLSRTELLTAGDAMAIGLADAVGDEDLDGALSAFLKPMLKQSPHVMRAFKALNLAQRNGASRQELLDLETSNFAAAWVHDDHWDAAEGILKKED
ncbi:MAG: enoyl-CoA hydratase/isomerase family protein [Alphaproteobacteria bacterium]|jgi:enoyl-CoA hydratase|nr:enoyl-CoA hydratase/isomerase family protein [Alphaproteobacteria bacterium]MDP6832936.1 enoyl-CoA hydratase/isomerase family protein [Alphaproteobacteria bacterium]MDP6874754.1 enoyl-CoA hydratase/isomerase family protein [Alphaproteobacteria bacterium]